VKYLYDQLHQSCLLRNGPHLSRNPDRRQPPRGEPTSGCRLLVAVSFTAAMFRSLVAARSVGPRGWGGTKSGYDCWSWTASTHSSVWSDNNHLFSEPPLRPQHHPGTQVTVVHAHFLQFYSGWLVMRQRLDILCLLWLLRVPRTKYAHG
jgi:hypothetical protein